MEYIKEKSKLDINKKRKNGEVFTPPPLINDMLDKLPNDVWNNPNLKWLDPCAGIANFPFIIYERLMIGLKDIIPDDEKRKTHILTGMIYMVELDDDNCEHIKEIFKGYNINLFEGSFFDYESLVFDIIVVNPPYQELREGNKKSKKIWHTVLYKCHDCLSDNGYLLPIHPCGWRDVNGMVRKIFDYNKARNLIYLNMNSYKAGMKYFKCCTNFDYYLLQNTLTNNNITKINDYDNLEYDINLNEWQFIPNGMFSEINELLKGDELTDVIHDCNYHNKDHLVADVIHDRSVYAHNSWNVVDVIHDTSIYETRIKYLSKTKTDTFKYPIVYFITKTDGIKLFYSCENKGHIGIPKVIWSNGKCSPIVDEKGEYGLTQFAYAIADDVDKLNDIKKALDNPYFIKMMSYCIFGKLERYNYKIIALMKKDFYKNLTIY